jgi:hypothetical protein|tara:strand:+ start:912 stop:1325 length:414 start_codon:yes stop_codon:yes gene_type:complete
MGEEFYGVIKLITGEELFSIICIDENDGDPIIMLQNPVIMKMLQNPNGQYVKIKPWLELPTDDMFLIKYDKIVTMTEISDEQMINFYKKYLNESEECDFEFDGRVKLNEKLGFITTVDDARKNLERIYNINIDKKES